MLSGTKLKRYRKASGVSVKELAEGIVRTGLSDKEARAAIVNWEQGRMVPRPQAADIEGLARVLGQARTDLEVWQARHCYAPMAPRKVRLVTDMICGYMIHDALDMLKFANKRAAVMVEKVLRSAIANADEQEADIERLYVIEARVDEGGVRSGTRRWRPKDRGRSVPWTRLASHIYVCLDVR